MYSAWAIILIIFWVWCSKRTAKNTLPLQWWMWPISFVAGAGLFGLAIYDYYRRKAQGKKLW
jgi:hypothetical protein